MIILLIYFFILFTIITSVNYSEEPKVALKAVKNMPFADFEFAVLGTESVEVPIILSSIDNVNTVLIKIQNITDLIILLNFCKTEIKC